MRKVIFLTALSLSVFSSFCQLSVSAEIRPRGEFRHGYKELMTSEDYPAVFVSQRSRLNFIYSGAHKLGLYLSLQDVRVWGDENNFTATGVYGDNASLDISQSYFYYKIDTSNIVKIGRQILKYDDQRILSERNWNQNGISYDAFLFSYKTKKLIIDMGLSFNNLKENTFGNEFTHLKIKTLNFLYSKQSLNQSVSVSEIVVASGFSKENTKETIYMTGTYGLNVFYYNKKLSLHLAGYYQNGRNVSGTSVSAFLTSLKAEMKINDLLKLNAGCTYISGNDATKNDPAYTDTDHTFDLLYGARHKYYGHMDYFSSLDESTAGGGLVDIFNGFEISGDRMTGSLDYHCFLLQNNVIDPSYIASIKKMDKYLGSEFDFIMSRNITEEIIISFGCSCFLQSESFEVLREISIEKSTVNYWGWVMITANPSVLLKK